MYITFEIITNIRKKETIQLFSIYLCRLRLKSFCDFIVVCNVTWQYFKDIIIIIIIIIIISFFFFLYFAWSINVIRMGVLTPIHWE